MRRVEIICILGNFTFHPFSRKMAVGEGYSETIIFCIMQKNIAYIKKTHVDHARYSPERFASPVALIYLIY